MSTPSKESASTVAVSTPSDREIRMERIFNAPLERVWRAMTEPELLAQWWGRGNRVVIERLEVERGGHWRFVEHSPEGVHGFEGRFREVTPPHRGLGVDGTAQLLANPVGDGAANKPGICETRRGQKGRDGGREPLESSERG